RRFARRLLRTRVDLRRARRGVLPDALRLIAQRAVVLHADRALGVEARERVERGRAAAVDGVLIVLEPRVLDAAEARRLAEGALVEAREALRVLVGEVAAEVQAGVQPGERIVAEVDRVREAIDVLHLLLAEDVAHRVAAIAIERNAAR